MLPLRENTAIKDSSLVTRLGARRRYSPPEPRQRLRHPTAPNQRTSPDASWTHAMPKTRSSNRTARDDRPLPALDPAAAAAAGPSSSRGTTSNPTPHRQTRKLPSDDGEDLDTIPRSSTRRIPDSTEVEGAPRRTKRRRPDPLGDDSLSEELPSRAAQRLPPVPKPLRSRRHRTLVEAVASAPGAYPNANANAAPSTSSSSRGRVFFAAGTDSPSLSPPPATAATTAFDLGPEGGGLDRDRLLLDDDDQEPADRLTRLPRELLQHIFSYIAAPTPPPPAARAAGIVAPLGGGGAGAAGAQPRAVVPAGPNANANNNVPPEPERRIDRHSLALAARTCRELLSHARLALYRDLHVETRVQAHALHRALHANEMSKDVRHVTANVELMAKTSSQWTGEPRLPVLHCRRESDSSILTVSAAARSRLVHLPFDALTLRHHRIVSEPPHPHSLHANRLGRMGSIPLPIPRRCTSPPPPFPANRVLSSLASPD